MMPIEKVNLRYIKKRTKDFWSNIACIGFNVFEGPRLPTLDPYKAPLLWAHKDKIVNNKIERDYDHIDIEDRYKK